MTYGPFHGRTIGAAAAKAADCRGSKAECEAAPAAKIPNRTGRQAVQCGVCARRFNVRVIRTRHGLMLPHPIVIVPRHIAEEATS